MEKTVFRIRKNFLIPLGLIVLLTLILLISGLFLQTPLAKTLILGAFMLPIILLFVESSLRRVSIGPEAVQINKLFRSKQMTFADLTSIDTVLVRKRAFVSLSSETDFILLSNSYENFGQLLQLLLEKAPDRVVSDETRQLAGNPPEKSGDAFSAWLAVGVLLLIIFVQLRGAF